MGELNTIENVKNMIYYFTICWDNAADGSQAKEMFQGYRLTLLALLDKLIAEEDDGK